MYILKEGKGIKGEEYKIYWL